jgi:hypothetical protein
VAKRYLLALIAALIACGSAQAGSGWVVIGHAAKKGKPPSYFTAVAAHAKAHRPHQVAVRVSGHTTAGIAKVTCKRGGTTARTSKQFHHPGLYPMKLPSPDPSNWPSCKVVAVAVGRLSVSVKILRR